ncbi:hypothetical protein COU91_02315, partial [Candidatus Saccharibacteria bacterium CG10_big_fil_rev_8_21_14_0_10_47_8]
ILADFDADSEKIRNEIIRLVNGPRNQQIVEDAAPSPASPGVKITYTDTGRRVSIVVDLGTEVVIETSDGSQVRYSPNK